MLLAGWQLRSPESASRSPLLFFFSISTGQGGAHQRGPQRRRHLQGGAPRCARCARCAALRGKLQALFRPAAADSPPRPLFHRAGAPPLPGDVSSDASGTLEPRALAIESCIPSHPPPAIIDDQTAALLFPPTPCPNLCVFVRPLAVRKQNERAGGVSLADKIASGMLCTVSVDPALAAPCGSVRAGSPPAPQGLLRPHRHPHTVLYIARYLPSAVAARTRACGPVEHCAWPTCFEPEALRASLALEAAIDTCGAPRKRRASPRTPAAPHRPPRELRRRAGIASAGLWAPTDRLRPRQGHEALLPLAVVGTPPPPPLAHAAALRACCRVDAG